MLQCFHSQRWVVRPLRAPVPRLLFARAARHAVLIRRSVPVLAALALSATLLVRYPKAFGQALESVSGLICNRGRAGPVICRNCTMFGRFGRIFGGSGGAAELINVWRGCVG